MKMKIKSNYELKDVDEKKGIVTGYASIFNNVDSDQDMIMPGAFMKTIQERGPLSAKPRIKHLWMHDSWTPIAVPDVLEEHDKGLYFVSRFGKDTQSQDKLQQHIDGIITEMSIGYNVIQQEDVLDENGKFLHRKLAELKLWEYSSVTWGANSLTSIISAKGSNIDIVNELSRRLDALNRGLKNSKYTDETCEQFEAEIIKIKDIIQSLSIKEPVPETTHVIVKPTINGELLKGILNELKTI